MQKVVGAHEIYQQEHSSPEKEITTGHAINKLQFIISKEQGPTEKQIHKSFSCKSFKLE